jgi:hypothetical protein
VLTNIVDRVHYNRILIVTTNKGEVMKQLELPLKFKPNTYESYTDAQKKEHWYANYCIKMMEMQKIERKVDTAVRMLKGLIDQIDHGIEVPESAWSNTAVKGRIRKICNDLKDKK